MQSGYHGGFNDGFGIVTSQSAAIKPSVLTALVTMSAADANKATFGGEPVSAGDQLVMYTWGGDANMDGTLNGDDYFRIDSHVAQSGTVFGYANGDFNYSGTIDGDDYFIIDSNIATAQSSPPFPTGSGAPALTAVPEPGSLAVVAIAACVFANRRRRHA